MSQMTSVTLLDGIKDPSDRRSWEEFTEVYYRIILNWLQGNGVGLHDAEDLAQDIMCVVCREITRFEHSGRPGAFRTWLRRVTANRLREFWRKRKRRLGGGPSYDELADGLVDNGTQLSQAFDREHDRSRIAGRPTRDRNLLRDSRTRQAGRRGQRQHAGLRKDASR